ncbi:MAG: PIN domain-containing protein [Bacteroidota bacterium]
MDYLLDSNIIIIYSRDDVISERIEKQYQLFNGNHRLAISIISIGEIEASILKMGLGEKRTAKIRQLINGLTEFGINFKEVIAKYAEIDAYSQGKIKGGKFSARNMGKNDIWIAATASNFDLKLVTTDKDFDHLKGEYIDLEYISLEEIRNQ